jgi:hypothetical protein
VSPVSASLFQSAARSIRRLAAHRWRLAMAIPTGPRSEGPV